MNFKNEVQYKIKIELLTPSGLLRLEFQEEGDMERPLVWMTICGPPTQMEELWIWF